MIQKPPSTSFASANGPSVTVGTPPGKVTRAPIDGGCKPSAEISIPAFWSDSLYAIMTDTAFTSGMAPGSADSYPFGIISIMNLIVVLLPPVDFRGPAVDSGTIALTNMTNVAGGIDNNTA